jgi:hypothetical protein
MSIKMLSVCLVGVVALPVLFLTSCVSFHPASQTNMEATLQQSNPSLAFRSSMKFGLGALTLDFVDFALVHEQSMDLSKIGRAEIGIYELSSSVNPAEFKLPATVANEKRCPQRDVIMRMREDDELVQVVACIRNTKVVGLEIFALEPKELAVISIDGDFEAFLRSVVKAKAGSLRKEKVPEPGKGERVTLSAASNNVAVSN